MAIEQEHLDTYRELFIHRQDLYAQQTPKGAYFLKRSPITDTVLRSHLQGAITAGFYALSPDNTTRWVVLDADRDDGLDQLQEAWQQLDAQGIPSQLEGSRRGGHLWILFEPTDAAAARRLVLRVLPDLEGVEVFPKRDRLDAGAQVGNLVRGPLGIHRLTGRRYPFLDPISLQPVAGSVQATLEYLQTIERTTPAQVAELLAASPELAKEPMPVPISSPGERKAGMRLSPIQQLKEQIGDPYTFISQYVELDAAGRGLCPFHGDVHPSFAVDRKRGFWTCFHEVNPKTGRYLGGDAVEFYRRLKRLSYQQAISELRSAYPPRSAEPPS
jgi:hypothetical protein